MQIVPNALICNHAHLVVIVSDPQKQTVKWSVIVTRTVYNKLHLNKWARSDVNLQHLVVNF